MKKLFLYFLCALFFSSAAAQAPAPYGALPSKAQLQWQNLEYYMFIHFGPNTFTDKEWGSGKENPAVFNPTQLDARQWARTAKLAGMKGIIITAKHHDGFCLWPSKYSTHTVRESPWKNARLNDSVGQGKGDVLKELSAACKEYGLKFGVYLSPWDRNHPAYGTPKYNQVFANMLKEIHTQYGPIFEQWFDGANGEGPNGKKQVYDWKMFDSVVLHYHPSCIIFSDNGPGCRWIGDEQGIAGVTNWSTLNRDEFYPGKPDAASILQTGQEGGADWIPGECDVPIRPGWFYSPETNDKVKSVNELMKIYFTSVGRNANLLLDVPVDRRGLIPPGDSARLMEFKKLRQNIFADNIALHASVSASNTRKGKGNFRAANLNDNNISTYWAADDNVHEATITLQWDKPIDFNLISLQEFIALGQRIKSFSVAAWNGKEYVNIANGTTIGHKRILQFPMQHTSRLQIHITQSKACPVLSEIEVFNDAW